MSKFWLCIAAYFDECNKTIGTGTELSERKELVGVFGLYALYQKLVPVRAKLDERFYKLMWEVQRRVPMVTLYGKSVWFPADFLMKHVETHRIRGLVPRPNASGRKMNV